MSQQNVIEQISDSVTCERRVAGQLVIMTITDARRETIDAYISTNKQTVANAPADRTLYMLHDISHPTVTLTPYFRQRLNEMADFLRQEGKTVYAAIILPNTLLFRVFTLFGDMFMHRAGKQKIINRNFTSREDGLKWLETLMQGEK